MSLGFFSVSAVSVIIVNWNGKNFLADCLNGLKRQKYEDFSITMVDNGSIDGSLDFVQTRYPEVKTIALAENSGFAVANNIAIQAKHTKFVALLNNDAVPHPQWLASLTAAMENNPEAGTVASKMIFHDNPGVIDRAGDAYTVAGAAEMRGRGEPVDNFNEPEWVFGACAGAALYRKRMLDDIGLFDEDFFLVYEDVDLSFRAQLRGYKCLYVPEAIVYHHAGSSIGSDTPTSVYYSHRNLEWVYIHNMPGKLIKKTLAGHLIYNFASLMFFIIRGRGGDFIRAKWHALKGLKRALAKRQHIQNSRTVTDDYIWSLFEKERLLPRLIRRISKNP